MPDYYQPLHNIAPSFPPPASGSPENLTGYLPVLPQTNYKPFYIPVAGPSPYNSLVLVRTVTAETVGSGPDGQGMTVDLTTNFLFPGYDFRNAGEIAFRHSTIVCSDMFQASESVSFQFDQTQVDKGFFADTGFWTVRLNLLITTGTAQSAGEVSRRWRLWSWILCYMPPAANLSPP